MKYKPAIVLAYFKETRLPEPVLEHRFHPTRKWRFDFAWPQHRVALEVENALCEYDRKQEQPATAEGGE